MPNPLATADPHLPTVHLRPPRNWVNDPNGLVFHDGAYHIFFQHNPMGARHANMHWGHFRSRDLLRWETLPIALAPSAAGIDADGVWSGNAVSTDDGILAFYAAYRHDRWWQPVAAATSHDGVHFDKLPGALIPNAPEGTTMFRDPFVWRDGGQWRMLVGAALRTGQGAALQYTSDDLAHWHYRGPYLARMPEQLPGDRTTEAGWECVQFADISPSCGALVFSAWNPEGGAAHAAVYIGEDRSTHFEPHRLQLFDYGPDCYAPAILRAPDGRWLTWSWIWEARDEPRVGAPSDWTDEVGWAGMLSLPRELTVTDGSLHQAVAHEIDLLRRQCHFNVASTVMRAAPLELGRVSRAADIAATLHRSTDGRAATGLRVVTSADGGEHLALRLDPSSGDVVVDRNFASLDDRAKRGSWSIPTGIPPGDSVGLRAVIDHSVVEVYLETGQVLTLRFYPAGQTDWRVVAEANGTGEAMLTAQAWELAPLRIDDESFSSSARGVSPR